MRSSELKGVLLSVKIEHKGLHKLKLFLPNLYFLFLRFFSQLPNPFSPKPHAIGLLCFVHRLKTEPIVVSRPLLVTANSKVQFHTA